MPRFCPLAVLRSDSKYSRTLCTLRFQIETRLLNSLVFIKIAVKSRMLREPSDKTWAFMIKFAIFYKGRLIGEMEARAFGGLIDLVDWLRNL